MSTNLTAVLQQLLRNTSNLKVLQQLMTLDATYVSLNFDNPELKNIEPWAGTHKGHRLCLMSLRQSNASGKHSNSRSPTPSSRVAAAFFGSFTYKSNVTGKEITSPFGLLARFEGGKVAYVQFLEDSYGTADSFKTGGKTRFHSDPSGKEVEI